MSRKNQKYVPYMAYHREELEQFAQDRFAFLTHEKGFVTRPSEVEVQSSSYVYANPHASLGVNVDLDFRDDTVRVYLFRLRDGEIPPNGFVDTDRGERIRVSFLSLLQGILHVEDAKLDELSHLLSTPPTPEQPRDQRWAADVLARWGDLVERHFDLVARQSLEVLFPPPPPGASPASQA